MSRSNVNVKLNLRGLNKLMTSEQLQAEAVKALEDVKQRSGVSGLRVIPSPHPHTAGAALLGSKRLPDREVRDVLGAVANSH